jgi:hypothetical protein
MLEDKNRSIVALHLFLILTAWTSWIFFDVAIILIGAALYYLQLVIFKNCILTKKQFDSGDASFYEYLLQAIGLKTKKETMNFLAIYIFPLVIISLAIIWQYILGKSPLIV